jgi:hypothetical protein
MSGKNRWRKIYINILLRGPSEAEYDYAAELIESGYAKGLVNLVNRQNSDKRVANLIWQGPTTSGREYLDDLQDNVRRLTIRYRLWTAFLAVSGWVVGIFTHFLVEFMGSL